MTGVQIIRRLALLLLVVALASVVVVACGGDDDDDAADDLTATPTTAPTDAGQAETGTAAPEGGDEARATSTEQEPPLVTADPQATATEPIPTATASATPEGGAESMPLTVLVIPPVRDEAIPQNGRVLGNPDAAVSIVEYGDFQ